MRILFLFFIATLLLSCEKRNEAFETIGRADLPNQGVLEFKVRKASYFHSEYERRVEVRTPPDLIQARELHFDLDGDISIQLEWMIWEGKEYLLIDDSSQKYLFSAEDDSCFYLFSLDDDWYLGPINGSYESVWQTESGGGVLVGKELAIKAQNISSALENSRKFGLIDWDGFREASEVSREPGRR